MNSTGEFARTCSGEGGRERRGLSAHSPSPRAQHPNPRSWIHERPRIHTKASGERRGKMDDSFSHTSSRERRVMRRRFSQNYISNPINRIAFMRKPQTYNTLTVWVIASDESRARRLTMAIFHGTSPRGEQSSAVCSRRSANGESVSEVCNIGPENRNRRALWSLHEGREI